MAGNGGLRRWQCLRRRSCGMCHVWHAWSVWHVRCVCVSGIINIYERCQKMQHVRAPVCLCVCGMPRFMPHDTIRYDIPCDIYKYMPPFEPQNMYLLSSKTHLKCHMRHMHKSTVHIYSIRPYRECEYHFEYSVFN